LVGNCSKVTRLQILLYHPSSCRYLLWLHFLHRWTHLQQRYSHLRKHIYALSVPPSGSFAGLDTHSDTGRTRFIHPVSTLSFGARGLPSDLALEPADTLSLYNALVARRQDLPDVDLASLDPVLFFTGQDEHGLLKQMDVIRYETALKVVVEGLLESSNPGDSASPLYRVSHQLDDPVLARVSEVKLNTVPSKDIFKGRCTRGCTKAGG
jgi:hypothetical protein